MGFLRKVFIQKKVQKCSFIRPSAPPNLFPNLWTQDRWILDRFLCSLTLFPDKVSKKLSVCLSICYKIWPQLSLDWQSRMGLMGIFIAWAKLNIMSQEGANARWGNQIQNPSINWHSDQWPTNKLLPLTTIAFSVIRKICT